MHRYQRVGGPVMFLPPRELKMTKEEGVTIRAVTPELS